MTTPLKQIHNAETNEIIVVELSPEELKLREQDYLEAQERLRVRQQQAQKRLEALAKLAALGLDEDDLRALGL